MTPARDKPALLFDGECGFCRLWVNRWRQATADRLTFAPYQEAASSFPQVDAAACERAVHLVEPDGAVTQGAAAVLRARELGMKRVRLARAYRSRPWLARMMERVYRFVADHRPFLSRLTRIVYGESVQRPTWIPLGCLLLGALCVAVVIALVVTRS